MKTQYANTVLDLILFESHPRGIGRGTASKKFRRTGDMCCTDSTSFRRPSASLAPSSVSTTALQSETFYGSFSASFPTYCSASWSELSSTYSSRSLSASSFGPLRFLSRINLGLYFCPDVAKSFRPSGTGASPGVNA